MRKQEIKKELKQLVSDKVVPGISYAIIDKNNVETHVFGKSQIIPIKKELRYGMLYDVASLTKVVGTTTLILNLVEKDRLSLNNKVADFIPLFDDQRVTVRHLLTHTSAISGYIPHRDELNRKELLDALDSLKVGDWFDKKVVYTDVGLIMLGQIIESFYHEPVQKTITEKILEPLNLKESTFNPQKQFSVPTEITDKRGLIQGEVHDPKAFVLKEHCASAGLFMTLNDLIKFANWILSDEHENDILTNQTINSLFKDWTTNHLQRSLGWDLRFSPDQTPWIYHTGYTGTFILLSKKYQQGLIVLTNRVHPSSDNQEFLDRRDKIVSKFIKFD